MKFWKPYSKKQHRLFGLIVLLAVSGGTWLRPFIMQHLHSWHVLPEPERLSELYFTDSEHLPVAYSPGKTQTLSFTVHNAQHARMDYRYQVTAVGERDVSVVLASNTFELPDGAYKTVLLQLRLPDVGAQGRIVVRLIKPAEQISYRVRRQS